MSLPTDKQFSHLENIIFRMNVMYKESEYELTNLIHVIEIKTKLFKQLTIVSLLKYFAENNINFYFVAAKDSVVLKIQL